MTAFISLTAFVSGIVIAYLFYSMKEFLFLNQNSNTRKDSFLLGIGVLSARENFEARQAIRDTWLSKQHSNDSYRGWFIIGNRSCDIHPENRVDEYGCERWKPEDQDSDVADLIDAYKISDGNLANSVNGPFNQQLVSEIYFKVMYPIRLKRLAIIEGLMSTTANNTYTVIVLNRRSQEKIATASFNDIDPGIKAGLFFHQAVENIMLEKGFEGALLLEGENVDANYDVTQTISATFTKTTWAGVSGTIVLQKPKLSNSSLKYFFSISLTAIIQKPGNLREVSRGQNARDQEWRQHQRVVGQRLFKEMKEFGDVIIVDTTDVYRNLVRKLMLFYKWLAEREKVQFVLKTDDDCFLNLEKIVTQLKTSGSDLTHFWWGNFRRQWFVETYGKWMELDYTADVYPAFACGSGYIIPREISQWLSQNAHRLHSYQGEDVSMGIYMATILPTLIDDKRWKCTRDCSREVLSLPQLYPGEMRDAWNSLNECRNPCGCS